MNKLLKDIKLPYLNFLIVYNRRVPFTWAFCLVISIIFCICDPAKPKDTLLEIHIINQAYTGLWLAFARFLKFFLCQCVCVHTHMRIIDTKQHREPGFEMVVYHMFHSHFGMARQLVMQNACALHSRLPVIQS